MGAVSPCGGWPGSRSWPLATRSGLSSRSYYVPGLVRDAAGAAGGSRAGDMPRSTVGSAGVCGSRGGVRQPGRGAGLRSELSGGEGSVPHPESSRAGPCGKEGPWGSWAY